MKISKYLFFVGFITVFIFFIPFFWLKPGEMDLGGDNSRLYFYDPIAYLISQSLYSVSHSAYGAENLSYYPIPFFLILALIKLFVHSPTILIAIIHGVNLSGGFFFCYLAVKELLSNEEDSVMRNRFIMETSSILAGLYYTFSQNPIAWWGYQLLPMNLVLVNPLMFYLLLRFFLTQRMTYLLISLLVTFIFSPNFSLIGAPTFFSFFPLAVLFLLIYTKYIKRKPIPIVKIALALVLFVLLQAFHLVPQIVSILTPGSFASEFIFGEAGKLQWGLKYFIATAPSIKVSFALLGLPQYVEPQYFWLIFSLFPILFILGFLWNRSRLYLLSAIFFLVTLFFISANITHLGLRLYVLAFRLPGFAMFRVFYGQWQWAYLFFYTIFLGMAISTVLGKFRNVQKWFMIITIVLVLLSTSWRFISGELMNTKLWQSKGISSHVEMDPAYEEMLSYIRSLPVDGKILSLPLNDHGYQILKGKNDAAYVGPSTITYLAARNEFTSNAELGAFGPRLLAAVRDGNYVMVRSILSALNIKYIFYNEDPYIYLDNFPNLPYTEVRKFFPDTQDGYKQLIKNLGVREVKLIAGKYHIYEFNDTSYIPHIFTSQKRVFWNDAIATNIHTPLSFYETGTRIALNDDSNIFKKYKNIFDDLLFRIKNESIIFDFFKKKKEDKFVSPTISRKLNSPVYPLVLLKEQRDLARFTIVNDAYIDRSIYFTEKRINELVRIEHVPLLKNVQSLSVFAQTWRAPGIWDWKRLNEYNSWEVTLVRYYNAIVKLIDDIVSSNRSSYSVTTEKVELKNYLKDHKDELRSAFRKESQFSSSDRKYISDLVENMFSDIFLRLDLTVPDITTIPYSLVGNLEQGNYELYVRRDDVKDLKIDLRMNGKIVAELPQDVGEWMRFEDISVDDTKTVPMTLTISDLPNLVGSTAWSTAEHVVLRNPVTLAITYDFLGDTSGLVRDISGWEEDTIYELAFDYLTYDQNFSLILHEKGGTKTHTFSNELYEETIRSNDWKHFSTAVLSSKDAKSAYLHIIKSLDDYEQGDIAKLKKISIKNLSVRKIYDPTVVLKKSVSMDRMSLPTISFRQINPSKYEVRVREAYAPFTLVLSQEFNQKWKLFLPGTDYSANTFKGYLARLVGLLLKKIINPYVAPAVKEAPIVDIYSQGSISEGKHTSILLDDKTFETWGQNPIAEKTHLPVNGYANSWYIEPMDVGNRSDYTLVIEMTSQKLFYGSLLLSGFGLLLVFVLLLKSFVKK